MAFSPLNETVARLEQAKELAQRFDAEITATYWTPGDPYDVITVLEASDPEGRRARSAGGGARESADSAHGGVRA
jgi:uncharacterized protein with GYD domain